MARFAGLAGVCLAGLTLSAVPAQAVSSTSPADASGARVLVVRLENIAFHPPTPGCPATRATFDLTSLRGAHRGSGVACVTSVVGDCEPLVAGCHQRVRARITYRVAQGSLTVRALLMETGTSRRSAIQHASGPVVSGTGAFARTSGTLDGAGEVVFERDGTVSSTLVHVIDVRRAS